MEAPIATTAEIERLSMALPDKDWEDTELIECCQCHTVLNGQSLWVVGDNEPKLYCENCYSKLMRANHD